MSLRPVYLVEARRTAIGRFGGGLKSLAAADLAVAVGDAVVPAGLREHVDQTILGQVLPAACGMNIARQAALKLGLPQSSPAFTVNMVCGSGLKAVALGADAIATGESELVLAGGAESMSLAPHYQRDLRWGRKLGDATSEDSIFVDGLTDPLLKISMGETAERLVDQHQISRADQDAFALRSQQLAAASVESFQREIVAITTKEGTVAADEHPRADTTIDKLAKLKPAFRPTGTVTAGNASGINDGAALVLLASEDAVAKHGLKTRARIVATAACGCAPETMGIGPVGAIRVLLERTGFGIDEVDAWELNEAFAAQSLACVRELGLPEAKVNPRGGAIALGHPVGASGARVLVTLLHYLEDTGGKRGVASLCIGGGMGIAMMVEREGGEF